MGPRPSAEVHLRRSTGIQTDDEPWRTAPNRAQWWSEFGTPTSRDVRPASWARHVAQRHRVREHRAVGSRSCSAGATSHRKERSSRVACGDCPGRAPALVQHVAVSDAAWDAASCRSTVVLPGPSAGRRVRCEERRSNVDGRGRVVRAAPQAWKGTAMSAVVGEGGSLQREPGRVGSSWRDHPRHGPLPALLLVLTVATGVVDAVSILALGRVFIANMTGNVVFIGFALAGAPGFSLAASLLALAGFLLGAAAGGPVVARLGGSRGRLLAVVTTAELVLLAGAVVVAALSAEPFATTPRDLIVLIAATALGLQNATARELAVPDATTTVLTMTLTGFAADLRQRNGQVLLRRLLPVGAMLVGALAGAALVLRESASWALALALLLVAVVCAGAWVFGRRLGGWQAPAQ